MMATQTSGNGLESRRKPIWHVNARSDRADLFGCWLAVCCLLFLSSASVSAGSVEPRVSAELMDAAIAGDAHARYRVGVAYLEGKAEVRDYRKAARWIEAAAMQRHPEAQFLLSKFHREGVGVPQHDGLAFTWAQHSVESDVHSSHAPRALLSLGFASEWARGVRQNLEEAYKWYSLASAFSPNDEDVHQAALRSMDALRLRLNRRELLNAQRAAERWVERRGLQTTSVASVSTRTTN